MQGCLEEALAQIIGEHRRIQGAGRTDSGVHALGQVAHVDIPGDKRHISFQAALNHHLPGDVAVVRVEPVHPDFHARYDAQSKTYVYSLWLERGYVLPQRSHYVWPTGPLDLEAMQEALLLLVGEHDFASFQNTGSEVKTTVRTMLEASLHRGETQSEASLRFKATGFLKQMVRNLTGCVVAVGQGRLPPLAVQDLLGQRDRSLAPPTAPARGLTLEKVAY